MIVLRADFRESFFFEAKMHKNPLYEYLKAASLSQSQFSLGTDNGIFLKKTDAKLDAYYLCELSVSQSRLLLDDQLIFRVKEQHLTIYSYEDNRNPHTSPYHFTAMIEGEDKRVHKLHVYFNHQDQVITAPRIDGVECAPSHADLFAEFAIRESRKTISTLREHRRQAVQRLVIDYRTQSEKFRLSYHAAQLRLNAESARILDGVIHTLSQLFVLDTSSRYRGIRNYFARLKRQGNQPNVAPGALLEKADEIDSSAPIEYEKSPPKNLTTKKIAVNLNSEIVNLRQLFLDYESERETGKKIDLFIQFSKQLAELDILVLESSQDDEIGIIDEFHYKSDAIGEKILLSLLLVERDYTKAAQLAQYLDENHEKLFISAMRSGNDELLEFILMQHAIPINTVLVQDKTAICFCLEHDYADQNKQIKCLGLLIKHHASTLVPASDGFPVAYHLHKGFRNPLRQLLLDNYEDTLGKPGYLRNLIEQMEEQARQLGSSASGGSSEPENALMLYRQMLKNNDNMAPKRHAQAVRELAPVIENISQCFDQSDLQRLRVDPDLVAALDKNARLNKELMSLLNGVEKIRAQREQIERVKKIEAYMTQLGSLASVNFETLKKSVIEFSNKANESLRCLIELKTLQKTVKGRICKTAHAANATLPRQHQLLQKIAQLDNEMTPPSAAPILSMFGSLNQLMMAMASAFPDGSLTDIDTVDYSNEEAPETDGERHLYTRK